MSNVTTSEIIPNNNLENNNNNNNNNNTKIEEENEDTSVSPVNRREQREGVVAPFVRKVYDMVTDPATDELIRWHGKDGRSVRVEDPGELGVRVLGRYFKTNNFCSFVRQLNSYGFRKVGHDGKALVYANEHFQRDNPQLSRIQRRRSGKKRKATRNNNNNNIDNNNNNNSNNNGDISNVDPNCGCPLQHDHAAAPLAEDDDAEKYNDMVHHGDDGQQQYRYIDPSTTTMDMMNMMMTTTTTTTTATTPPPSTMDVADILPNPDPHPKINPHNINTATATATSSSSSSSSSSCSPSSPCPSEQSHISSSSSSSTSTIPLPHNYNHNYDHYHYHYPHHNHNHNHNLQCPNKSTHSDEAKICYDNNNNNKDNNYGDVNNNNNNNIENNHTINSRVDKHRTNGTYPLSCPTDHPSKHSEERAEQRYIEEHYEAHRAELDVDEEEPAPRRLKTNDDHNYKNQLLNNINNSENNNNNNNKNKIEVNQTLSLIAALRRSNEHLMHRVRHLETEVERKERVATELREELKESRQAQGRMATTIQRLVEHMTLSAQYGGDRLPMDMDRGREGGFVNNNNNNINNNNDINNNDNNNINENNNNINDTKTSSLPTPSPQPPHLTSESGRPTTSPFFSSSSVPTGQFLSRHHQDYNNVNDKSNVFDGNTDASPSTLEDWSAFMYSF